MGRIIQPREVELLNRWGVIEPIIYCTFPTDVQEMAISVNAIIAEKLIRIKKERRSMRMVSCLQEVLDDLPNDVVIKDFDVLFNPEYEIDVLQSLINVCKVKPFRIIWPGQYRDGKLIYAEEGYPDYKVFNIADYDITCVR